MWKKKLLASNEDVLPHTAIFLFPMLIISTLINLNTLDIDGIPIKCFEIN